MPIKDRSAYPHNWKDIRAAILSREGNRCKICRVEHGAVIIREQGNPEHFSLLTGTGEAEALAGIKPVRIILTIAHLDHDTTNNDYSNLAALCQLHHLRHDAKLHAAHAAQTRRKKAIEQGQALLLEEDTS